jgi:hypothetical protein
VKRAVRGDKSGPQSFHAFSYARGVSFGGDVRRPGKRLALIRAKRSRHANPRLSSEHSCFLDKFSIRQTGHCEYSTDRGPIL